MQNYLASFLTMLPQELFSVNLDFIVKVEQLQSMRRLLLLQRSSWRGQALPANISSLHLTNPCLSATGAAKQRKLPELSYYAVQPGRHHTG